MPQMLMAVLKMYQSKIAQRNGGTNPVLMATLTARKGLGM